VNLAAWRIVKLSSVSPNLDVTDKIERVSILIRRS